MDKFRIAVRKFGPFEVATKKFWDLFCQKTGCELALEMVVMDLHELHEKTLTKNGLINGDFDVAHINTDWLNEGFESNAFEILNDYLTINPPPQFDEAWSNSLLQLQNFDGKIVGIPFHDGPECLLYRKDLFEDHDEQAAYFSQYNKRLRVPKTWDEFYEVSKFFNRPEKGIYGSIFACYPDGHNAVFDYCLQLWSRGGNLLDREGKIKVDTDASVESLKFYRNLVKDTAAVHPGSANFDSVAAGIAFSQGEAAMMINWFGFATMAELAENSKVKGKIYVDLLPSNPDQISASLNVYWLYTIASGSKYKKLAYEFIRFASNVENDKLLTLEGGIGCRTSTWNDSQINRQIPYYHKLETLHVVAKMLPRHQNWAQIAAIIDEMVIQAITTCKSELELVSHAQEKINQIQDDSTN